MVKRFRIGINFFFDNQSNSGVVNYIFNIISALKTVDESKKPRIVVFYSLNAPIEFLKQIDYPYIRYILFNPHPNNYLIRRANSLIRMVFKKDIYKYYKYFNKIDCLYPYFEFMDLDFVSANNKIHWLVDFNNKAFPEHYEDGSKNMDSFQLKLTSSKERIVLSSNTLLNELETYYPNYKCKVHILRFASSLPLLEEEDVNEVKKKYQLDNPYFMSPNQFWEHKNQMVVLDALCVIKNKYPYLNFKIIFTGSLQVNRGKGFYVDKLRQKVIDNGLDDNIIFLGVIERKEQLLLMKGAIALIQPSLYEGWSTLVEESKALNKFILLSNIPVHQEQISLNVDFFDPYNPNELADKIHQKLTSPSKNSLVNYNENIKKFGEDILNILTF